MPVVLTDQERAVLSGGDGTAAATAMRIVVDAAELLGAQRLVEIVSAHVDGCLYHGDGGVQFAEHLVQGGGRVAVPTTLNVGALDLLHPGHVRADAHRSAMARRQMEAYVALGCQPTWTCAPYQAGHRPRPGQHVAWGESNAVVFANSVLGARTARYGDFLDECCAVTGRAPLHGLHLSRHRRATVVVDATGISPELLARAVFYPVFGTWLGHEVGDAVAAVVGLPPDLGEDDLKALGAAASSSGAVGLVHVVGVTPEAPTLETALGGATPDRAVTLTAGALKKSLAHLSTTEGERVDAVAVGSPHFSRREFAALAALLQGRRLKVPFYACTGRDVLASLEADGSAALFADAGVRIVVDTCIVVTPILPAGGGVLMTSSGKFAHYGPSNTGYQVVFGSLEDCVASAVLGRVVRDPEVWT